MDVHYCWPNSWHGATQMRIWIPGKFPNLNDYIKAERANRFAAAGMKKKWTQLVVDCVEEQASLVQKMARLNAPMWKYPLTVSFIVHEENRRRDVDNVSATVAKFCLDGLVKAEILPDDSQKYVDKIECDLVVDGKVGVEILIDE